MFSFYFGVKQIKEKNAVKVSPLKLRLARKRDKLKHGSLFITAPPSFPLFVLGAAGTKEGCVRLRVPILK